MPTTEMVMERDNRIARLEAALNECAAPFRFGTEKGIEWENIAREFSRRMRVAADALDNAPVAQEVEAGHADP